MKRSIQLLLLLPLLWAAGCQKEASTPGSETTGKPGEKPVHIRTAIANPSKATKAVILGTTIPDGFSYGLFVCNEGETDENNKHKDNSWNLKASYKAGADGNDGKWTYQYVDNMKNGSLTPSFYDNITITAREDQKKADLYAYSPYMEGAYLSDPTAIPFSFANGSQSDLMYAVENAGTDNKGLDPLREDVETLPAHFTFKHALALLVFEFKLKNHISSTNTSNYILKQITVNNKKFGTSVAKLYKEGTFNAVDGSFSSDSDVNSLEVSANNLTIQHRDDGPDGIAYLLLVPTDLEDDELEMEFNLSSTDDVKLPPFVLKKEDLKHIDGTYGFQGGYKYTFHFTLDNFLYLNGVTISDEWTEGEELTPIEI